ncbi:hypothetical protein C8Q72DRAFT_876832 [Fomitopsis betulina]|nr:hypothetical protein C8Q72DRAFT_876832 [Fomitopsis betulina]
MLANIHLSITPDVLHQLYQGIFKHVLQWCSEAMDEKELDQCIRCLRPRMVSGSERKDMARILLGCLVGAFLMHSCSPSAPSWISFTSRSTDSRRPDTQVPRGCLVQYHKHKDILKTLGIRQHLNIPNLGTTDNYNTEMFERLHIDCAKKAWRALNHRNERPQMTKWLERREKMPC